MLSGSAPITKAKTMASRCTTGSEVGGHIFEINGYRFQKGIGVGKFVRSNIFAVGGFDWAIRFYPDGVCEAYKEYISVYLELMSDNAEVRALYSLRLVNQVPGLSNWELTLNKQPVVFSSRGKNRFGTVISHAYFKLRSDLELPESGFIKDNRLTIKCLLLVIKESHVCEPGANTEIEVPRSDITQHLSNLLESKEGADVSFIVGGEIFEAHKIVLAMRSPVLKAELCGEMREARMARITIKEMQPEVFRALLHFIYTDSLPNMGNLQGGHKIEMIRHLLVAADRYAMDRLKLICQHILGKSLHVDNVATTLALADQHSCDKLKKVCIEFMASSNAMDAVAATGGYANLKRTSPSLLVDDAAGAVTNTAMSFGPAAAGATCLVTLPPELSAYVRIILLPLPVVDGLPEGAESTADVLPKKVELLKKAIDGLATSFAAFLADAYAAGDWEGPDPFSERLDWVVVNFVHGWLPPIADDHQVKCAFFPIYSAAALAFLGPKAVHDVHLRTEPKDFMSPLPWITFPSTIAYRRHEAAMVAAAYWSNASGVSDLDRMWQLHQRCHLIVYRSCPDIEGTHLCSLLDELYHKPIMFTGLLLPPNAGDDRDRADLMRWLNEQPTRSVVYVVLGTEASVTSDNAHELALGLELAAALRNIGEWLLEGYKACVAGRGVVETGSPPLASSAAIAVMGTGSKKKKTVSWCTTEVSEGTHAFKIVGYSLNKGIGVGTFIRSGTFAVGGHDWAIRFYPDGVTEDSMDYVSVYLELMSENAKAMAFYTLGLVDPVTGEIRCNWSRSSPRLFDSSDSSRFGPRSPLFIPRSDLEMEESGYIVNDRLTVECEVTVIKGPQVSRTIGYTESEIGVPPSELSEHFGKLLEEEEEVGRDVVFSVEGESFAAHKLVLAARSLVFKAEFYGEMIERGTFSIDIKDMQPSVFRALLHFIYTDVLPADIGDLEGDDYVEMIRHLLMAADRYAMDRLKLMCQSILVKHVDVKNVATTLALADQHNCDRLKDVCIQYISSLDEVDAMVRTKGYANLKRSCPSVLADLFEKTSKFRSS
uniref:BTB domain-containing protein n=1 Tax=Oryza glumipatula TaxID=40148 RepID=A0A0E0ASE6_9ORYZ